MRKQLHLGLTLSDGGLYRLERFVALEKNRAAFSAAVDFLQKKGGRSFVITGPAVSGKTHLLKGIYHAWRPKKSAVYLSAEVLSQGGRKPSASFKGYYRKKLVCIDGLDTSGLESSVYDAVFHLFNAVLQNRGFIAFAMRRSPASCPFLPDYLSSRLLSGMLVRLDKPGEEERKEIFKKLAYDSNLDLTPRALDYVLERAPRSIPNLAAFLERLVENIGPGRKRIGLQLIRRVIDSKVL